MRSSQLSGNPGELLFNHLLTRCTTKKARIAAINKILESTGGDVTVKAAHDYGMQRSKSFNLERKEVKVEMDKLFARKSSMRDIEFEYELAKLEVRENQIAQNERNISTMYFEVINALDAAIKEYKDEKELNDIIELSKDVYQQQQTPRPQ